MITVIKRETPKQITCSNCKSILEYEIEDVRPKQTHMNEFADYITCPVCKREIQVN
jgi:Zn finger protein HypA/HybF involved in hydrogenase expression